MTVKGLHKRLETLMAKDCDDFTVEVCVEPPGKQIQEPVSDTAVSYTSRRLILLGSSFDSEAP